MSVLLVAGPALRGGNAGFADQFREDGVLQNVQVPLVFGDACGFRVLLEKAPELNAGNRE